MSSTYKVTGINLKSMPMGEYDRRLTILTREEGLVQAISLVLGRTNPPWGRLS